MKYLVTFVSGVFVGAIVALLFAPSSGEELRVQLQAGAETELKKAEAEWQKAKTSLQKPEQTSEEPEAPVVLWKSEGVEALAESAAMAIALGFRATRHSRVHYHYRCQRPPAWLPAVAMMHILPGRDDHLDCSWCSAVRKENYEG